MAYRCKCKLELEVSFAQTRYAQVQDDVPYYHRMRDVERRSGIWRLARACLGAGSGFSGGERLAGQFRGVVRYLSQWKSLNGLAAAPPRRTSISLWYRPQWHYDAKRRAER